MRTVLSLLALATFSPSALKATAHTMSLPFPQFFSNFRYVTLYPRPE
jgi:hypothetical protein